MRAIELAVTVTVEEKKWVVAGLPEGHRPRRVKSPLKDNEFLLDLVRFRALALLAFAVASVEQTPKCAPLFARAQAVGRRLTAVLLTDAAREKLAACIAQAGSHGVRLRIRAQGSSRHAEQALSLPWELIQPVTGCFPVEDGRLTLVREVLQDPDDVVDDAPVPLSVGVLIAAPEGLPPLPYEDEAFRLAHVLGGVERVAFADLGRLDDILALIEQRRPSVIHFSGHGEPGALLFEDAVGGPRRVSVGLLCSEISKRLRAAGGAWSLPRIFFLGACHGATEVPSLSDGAVDRLLDAALDKGPSTAASLHRSGFAHVIGYFGPVSDALSTRAETAFYTALAQGATVSRAVQAARRTLCNPIDDGQTRYPFAWAQLALYQRGHDQAVAGTPGEQAADLSPKLGRSIVQVSGLPILEHGFIGRRALQHEILRKIRRRQRLIVLQGMGGIGKTALACHLLTHHLAREPSDAVILRAGEIAPGDPDPIDVLRRHAEEHGALHGLPDWDEKMKALREGVPDPEAGLHETIIELRKARPHAVVYVDNLETLQNGPGTPGDVDAGAFRPAARALGGILDRVAEGGLVLISTRYLWKGHDPGAVTTVGPMRQADSLRQIETCESLRALPFALRAQIAKRVDGHPGTVTLFETAIRRAQDIDDITAADAWRDITARKLPEVQEQITADLLLTELWAGLDEEVREHASRLCILRAPAPRLVVQRLGGTTETLIRMGFLSSIRQLVREGGVLWAERWSMHTIVADFVRAHAAAVDPVCLHEAVGIAYTRYMDDLIYFRSDAREAVYHLHAARLGDQAWPIVEWLVSWEEDHAHYREALALLERCEAAGTTGTNLGITLLRAVRIKNLLAPDSEEIDRLLERASGLFDPEDQAELSYLRARLLVRAGRSAAAEPVLRRVTAFYERAGDLANPIYGAAQQMLISMLWERDQHFGAAVVVSRALARVVARDVFGDGPPSRPAEGSLEETAKLRHEASFVDDDHLVASTLRRVLAAHERAPEQDPEGYRTSLGELATTLLRQGRYREAEGLFRRALSSGAAWRDVRDQALLLARFADALAAQGKLDEAEASLRQALPLLERSVGEQHPDYAHVLSDFGDVLLRQGRLSAAEVVLRQAEAAVQQVLGPDSILYDVSVSRLADAFGKQGKHAEAEALLRNTLALKEASRSSDDPSLGRMLQVLALTLAEQRRFEEAESVLRRAHRIALQSFGEAHADTARPMFMVAMIHSIADNPQIRDSVQAAKAALRRWRAESDPEFRRMDRELSKILDKSERAGGVKAGTGRARSSGVRSSRSDTADRGSRTVWGAASMAISPDRALIAFGCAPETVSIWNLESGAHVRELRGDDIHGTPVAFSPGAQLLASRFQGNVVRLWESSGAVVTDLLGHDGDVSSLAFSPRGDLVASASYDNTVRLWNVARRETVRVLEGHSFWVESVAFSPDGSVVASGAGDSTLRVWDASTGAVVRVIDVSQRKWREVRLFWSTAVRALGRWREHGEIKADLTEKVHTMVEWVSFSPDGSLIASVLFGGTAVLWKTATGAAIWALTDVSALAFSPRGARLATGSKDGTVRLWDISSRTPVRAIATGFGEITAIAFSSDGFTFVSAFEYGPPRLYDVASGREMVAYHLLPIE